MNQKPYTWPVEFVANGELNATGRLTDRQIKQVTSLIVKLGGQAACTEKNMN